MRKLDVLEDFDAVIPSDAERGGGPFADAVERDDRRLPEGAWEKGGGGMALVVLREKDFTLVSQPLSKRSNLRNGLS